MLSRINHAKSRHGLPGSIQMFCRIYARFCSFPTSAMLPEIDPERGMTRTQHRVSRARRETRRCRGRKSSEAKGDKARFLSRLSLASGQREIGEIARVVVRIPLIISPRKTIGELSTERGSNYVRTDTARKLQHANSSGSGGSGRCEPPRFMQKPRARLSRGSNAALSLYRASASL